LIDLEALQRALHQLQAISPTKNGLVQLTSIRAVALACQHPLQDFLLKISKFEKRLGTFNAANNGWRSLARKMQFRVLFKDDIEQLRLTLASHVATLNLLLMTQAVNSISVAENDRDRLASGLERKILRNRQLLGRVNHLIDGSSRVQQEIGNQLEDQSAILNKLEKRADETLQHLHGQQALIKDIQASASQAHDNTESILGTMTELLVFATSGIMNLRQITKQLATMIRICSKFTVEMRTAMSKLMELFFDLQTALQRLDHSIPARLYLPTVQFTTALGESMALPYQLCQQWKTFRELLAVIFIDKPGKTRVDTGRYLIMNARGGRLLAEGSWQHAVKQDDHLSMSIVLDDLAATDGTCPFPACKASVEAAKVTNGGRACGVCGRWSALTPLAPAKRPNMPTQASSNTGSTDQEVEELVHTADEEDIELYRQVHVQFFPTVEMERRVVNNLLTKEDQLRRAVANWNEASVQMLLENGANIEAEDAFGGAALHWAVVRLLLEKGADIESKNDYSMTPLHWAAINSHEAVVRVGQDSH